MNITTKLILSCLVTILTAPACAEKSKKTAANSGAPSTASPTTDSYSESKESRSLPGTDTAMTAENQGRTKSDMEMTRMIREKITANEELSIGAQNIKIITNKGRVTLKGTVANAAEKQEVEAIARGVAGQDSVINQTVISE